MAKILGKIFVYKRPNTCEPPWTILLFAVYPLNFKNTYAPLWTSKTATQNSLISWHGTMFVFQTLKAHDSLRTHSWAMWHWPKPFSPKSFSLKPPFTHPTALTQTYCGADGSICETDGFPVSPSLHVLCFFFFNSFCVKWIWFDKCETNLIFLGLRIGETNMRSETVRDGFKAFGFLKK